MKKYAERIQKLEEKFWEDFKWGSTRIDPECLTETEKKLFTHVNQMTPPTQPNLEYVELWSKFDFFAVRRVINLLMKVMNLQLRSFEEIFVFWSRFIDFVSETMFIINCQRASDFNLKSRFGEDVDNWPEYDDPVWNDFWDWKEKWQREFKKFWKRISFTSEKLFFQKNVSPTKDERVNKTTKKELQEMFEEIISHALTKPSRLDMDVLAFISSLEGPEALDKILRKTKRKILEQKQ